MNEYRVSDEKLGARLQNTVHLGQTTKSMIRSVRRCIVSSVISTWGHCAINQRRTLGEGNTPGYKNNFFSKSKLWIYYKLKCTSTSIILDTQRNTAPGFHKMSAHNNNDYNYRNEEYKWKKDKDRNEYIVKNIPFQVGQALLRSIIAMESIQCYKWSLALLKGTQFLIQRVDGKVSFAWVTDWKESNLPLLCQVHPDTQKVVFLFSIHSYFKMISFGSFIG